ncbi:ADP-forming succinate--CoA ligase subunit beta [Candidatus Palauibacter sp.]|uniref:ADP-forming succinate--CoA ligase subunit beta n=1 Tax=Candidatus Palauibacter sp. TaxID=3101350 RepID=UPI003B52FA6F
MNIHEYQARRILARHGIPVPEAEVAATAEEAAGAAERFGGPVVVKAQVHAGGRGKAGGVKLAATSAEARSSAEAILGMEIKGIEVRRVLVAPAEEIASEAYVGIVLDRARRADTIMVSSEGGVDIEEVAATMPEAIRKVAVDPRYGLLAHQGALLGHHLYDDPRAARQASSIIAKLYEAYRASGATLAEINPMIVNPAGEVKAIDAKMNIDDNALFRLPEIAALRDTGAENPVEVRAREAELSYIQLDGNVGCCVNGAGLAMATMDLVKYYGGEPANFLDIGGSSNPDKVVAALALITEDPNVNSILFNIFGGITRCDDVANGIVEATSRMELGVPITIRLTGTNEEEGVAILASQGFEAMVDMDRAVETAVRQGATRGFATDGGR